MMHEGLAVVRGAGDVATGVAYLLKKRGFDVVLTEVSRPKVIRRGAAFASAVYEGRVQVEGQTALRASNPDQAASILGTAAVPVLVDPTLNRLSRSSLNPHLLVDCIMAKNNLGTEIDMAPYVLGVGPGFEAGKDVDAVVRSQPGEDVGDLLFEGSFSQDDGRPVAINGYSWERVHWAPQAGRFVALRSIGEQVDRGESLAGIGGEHIVAEVGGIIRGLIKPGLTVKKGTKVAEIDPRRDPLVPYRIAGRALKIGGGVFEGYKKLISPGEVNDAA